MAAQAFNLVARLQLQGPQNLTQIVNRIQSRLNSIQANVSLNISPAANTNLQALNRTLGQTNTLLQQVASNANAAQTALNNIGRAATNMGQQTQRAGRAAAGAASNVQAIGANAAVAGSQMQEFGRISALAVRRFLAFSIPAGIIVGLTVNIKQGVRAAIDFEREMIRVQQVTARTSEGLSGLRNEIARLGTTFGAASGELVEVSRTLAQAGLTAKQTKTALEAIAKTDLSPTFDSMKQTTEGAIAAMRQFGLEAEQLEAKLSSINAVAGQFAVESSDIISAIRRTGGAFKAAGGNLEQLIALFTSVRSTTRESADSIATGFRTIFTRIQRPRTIQFLREFGIELQDTAGKFVGPYEAVRRLNRELQRLDPRDVRFSRITEELGGFRQVSKVIPLVQQFAVSEQALAVALAGTESAAEDAALAQSALAVQLSKVQEVWSKLYRDVVGSDTFKVLAGTALEFAKNLAEVLRYLKDIVPLLLIAGGIKAFGAVRQFGAGFRGGLLSKGEGPGLRRFARGGMVPGTGSGDTVPAMLEPGEFVVRKRAVQAVGAHNLQSMNARKMAKGGRVTVGAVGMNPIGHASTWSTTEPVRDKRLPYPVHVSIVEAGMAKAEVSKVEGNMAKGVVRALSGGARELASLLGIGRLPGLGTGGGKNPFWKNILVRTGLVSPQPGSTEGKAMEAILSRIGGRGLYDAKGTGTSKISKDPGLPFDFPFGIRGKMTQMYPTVSAVKPVEAKRDVASSTSRINISKTKVPAYFGPILHAQMKAQAASAASVIGSKKFIAGAFGRMSDSEQRSYMSVLKNALNPKKTAVSAASVNSKLAKMKGLTAQDRQALSPESFTKAYPPPQGGYGDVGQIIAQARAYTGMAKGGRVSDKVPALLTPGEFVINKSAAQSVGYNNLRSINNVRGYARGGVVGNVGAGAGGNLFNLVIFSTLAQSMAGTNEGLQKLIGTITKTIIAFEAARLAIGTFQGISGTFARGIGSRRVSPFVGSANPVASAMSTSRTRIGFGQLGAAFTGRGLGYVRTGAGTIGTQPRFFGSKSALNVGTQALTGFSAGLIATTAATATVTAALLYFGNKVEEAANKTAEEARTREQMEEAYQKARLGGVLKTAGYGTAIGAGVGAAIGSVVPVLGTAVGGAIGALLGGVGGALVGLIKAQENREKELRKINREARFTESTEQLGADLKRLLSGDIVIAGSVEYGRAGGDIEQIMATIREARADDDAKEQLIRTRGLRNLAPQLDTLKNKFIESGSTMEEFTKAGRTGTAIVEAYALLQKESIATIEKRIAAEIEARDAAEKRAKADRISLANLTNTLNVLKEFRAAVTDLTQRLNTASNQIGVLASLNQGRTAIGSFTGQPGFGQFGRIVKEGVANRDQYQRAVDQMFGGSFGASELGGKVRQRMEDMVTMIDEIPSILEEVARDPALGKDNAGVKFRALADEQFKDLEQAGDVINTVVRGIDSFLGGQGEGKGAGAFKDLGQANPIELFLKTGGKDLGASLDELDNIAKDMVSNLKVFDEAIVQAVEQELALYKKRLELQQQGFKDAQVLFKLGDRIGRILSPDVFTAQKRTQTTTALAGTRAAGADPFDVARIGNAFRNVNQEIRELNKQRQTLTPYSGEMVMAQQKLRDLNTESAKLRTALEGLRDVTDEATQIQQTLNKLEDAKKARFSIAERYTFGTRKDREQILQSIIDTVRVVSGERKIDDIPEERRGAISQLLKQFDLIPTLLAGVNPDGTARRGIEARSDITLGRMAQISLPEFARALFGMSPNLDLSESDVSKVTPAEQALIDGMEVLFNRRASAEEEFLKDMEANNSKLGEIMSKEFASFSARLVAALTTAERRKAQRDVDVQQGRVDTATLQQQQAEIAQEIVNKVTGEQFDLAGGARIAKAISDQKEQINNISRSIAAGQLLMPLSGQYGGIDERFTRTWAGETAEIENTDLDTRREIRDFFRDILVKTQQRKYNTYGYNRSRAEQDITEALQPFFRAMSKAGAKIPEEAQNALIEDFVRTTRGGYYKGSGWSDSDIRTIQYRTTSPGNPYAGEKAQRQYYVTDAAANQFTKLVLTDLGTAIQKESRKEFGEMGEQFGMSASEFENLIRSYREPLEKAAASLKDLSSPEINKLPQTVKDLTKSLKELEEVVRKFPSFAKIQAELDAAVEELNAATTTGRPVADAYGGSIFKRQGTDTVPAMLTPGEFVVRRAAAQKHMGLLQAINRGGSPPQVRDGVMYADGGGGVKLVDAPDELKPGMILTIPKTGVMPHSTVVVGKDGSLMVAEWNPPKDGKPPELWNTGIVLTKLPKGAKHASGGSASLGGDGYFSITGTGKKKAAAAPGLSLNAPLNAPKPFGLELNAPIGMKPGAPAVDFRLPTQEELAEQERAKRNAQLADYYRQKRMGGPERIERMKEKLAELEAMKIKSPTTVSRIKALYRNLGMVAPDIEPTPSSRTSMLDPSSKFADRLAKARERQRLNPSATNARVVEILERQSQAAAKNIVPHGMMGPGTAARGDLTREQIAERAAAARKELGLDERRAAREAERRFFDRPGYSRGLGGMTIIDARTAQPRTTYSSGYVDSTMGRQDRRNRLANQVLGKDLLPTRGPSYAPSQPHAEDAPLLSELRQIQERLALRRKQVDASVKGSGSIEDMQEEIARLEMEAMNGSEMGYAQRMRHDRLKREIAYRKDLKQKILNLRQREGDLKLQRADIGAQFSTGLVPAYEIRDRELQQRAIDAHNAKQDADRIFGPMTTAGPAYTPGEPPETRAERNAREAEEFRKQREARRAQREKDVKQAIAEHRAKSAAAAGDGVRVTPGAGGIPKTITVQPNARPSVKDIVKEYHKANRQDVEDRIKERETLYEKQRALEELKQKTRVDNKRLDAYGRERAMQDRMLERRKESQRQIDALRQRGEPGDRLPALSVSQAEHMIVKAAQEIARKEMESLGLQVPEGLQFGFMTDRIVAEYKRREGGNIPGGFFNATQNAFGISPEYGQKLAQYGHSLRARRIIHARLQRTVKHEVAHAIDYAAGKGQFASMKEGTALNDWMAMNREAIGVAVDERLKLPGTTKFAQETYRGNPKEWFAMIMAAKTPRLRELRDNMLAELKAKQQARLAKRFHQGGLVPGTGDVPSVLQGGEYVLPKPAVQAMAKGGVVKGYQEGGPVTSGSAEIRLSAESQSALASISETLKTTAESVRTSFAEIPTGIETALGGFTSSLDTSSQAMQEAANTFQASVITMQESAAAIPEAISTALNDGGSSLVSASDTLSQAIAGLGNAVTTWSDSVTQMQQMVADLATTAQTLGGAASEIAQALATEMTISVTHTHEPITVNVEGGESTTQDGSAFEEMVMRVVGPEIDALRDRIRENGFGTA